MSELSTFLFRVTSLTNEKRAQRLKQLLNQQLGIEAVVMDLEKRTVAWTAPTVLDLQQLKQVLTRDGFHLQELSRRSATSSIATAPPPSPDQQLEVCVDGMTCRSCELTIERAWKKMPGVKQVNVHLATGAARLCLEGGCVLDCHALQTALSDQKYHVRLPHEKKVVSIVERERPSFWQLVGLFTLVLLLGSILSRFGLLKPNFSVGSAMSFGAVFVVGLVAASSSCIAVTGGLLLSVSAKFNERYGSKTGLARLRPVLLFIAGRVAGYAVLGGLLGVLGGILTPSPFVTAVITIIAALYMLIMGLEMLHIAPYWLKRFLPRLPKALSHRIVDAESKEHPLMPSLLGAATFFLPCGFTQALQLYALTTGSFWAASTILFAFALGTAPVLFALGYASSSLKGRAGQWFFRFSGALVVVLGLWNIQNGFAIAGYPLSLDGFFSSPVAVSSASSAPSGPFEAKEQVLKMAVDYRGYTPNRLRVKAGSRVRWEVMGSSEGLGCASLLQSPSLGIRKLLSSGLNVISFTAPTKPGVYSFSCSMGMYRGQLEVI